MASGHWVTGISNVLVAKEFGVSLKTIASDAAEASRQIREAFGSNEDLKARLMATLESIVAETRRARQNRTAVEALRLLSDISGVAEAKKLAITTGPTMDDIAKAREAARQAALDNENG